MNDNGQTTRMLHDEHIAVLGVLRRLDSLLAQYPATGAPQPLEPAAATLLGDLAALCANELPVHFAFEEDELFPRLSANGDSPIEQILNAEHEVILPLAVSIGERAGIAKSDGFDAAGWVEFRRGASELVERLTSHIQKEEMGLLPAIDDLLEGEQDWRLAQTYAEAR